MTAHLAGRTRPGGRGGSPSGAGETAHRGALARLLTRTTAVLVLCTAGYFALPTWATGGSAGASLARVVASGLAFAGLVVLVVALARRARDEPVHELRSQWLLIALYLVVLGFALTYLVVVRVSPQSFPEIRSKTDALYFSVMLLSTVGLGDVHPVGSLGRLVVTVNILVDVVYVGRVIRVAPGGRPAPVRDGRPHDES